MINKKTNHFFKVFLGTDPNNCSVYLTGFTWDSWYWRGGFLIKEDEDGTDITDTTCIIVPFNFYDTFLDGRWEDLIHLTNSPFSKKEWYSLQKLYDNYYTLERAARIFESGSAINIKLNKYIQKKIIPDIEKVLLKVK